MKYIRLETKETINYYLVDVNKVEAYITPRNQIKLRKISIDSDTGYKWHTLWDVLSHDVIRQSVTNIVQYRIETLFNKNGKKVNIRIIKEEDWK